MMNNGQYMKLIIQMLNYKIQCFQKNMKEELLVLIIKEENE